MKLKMLYFSEIISLASMRKLTETEKQKHRTGATISQTKYKLLLFFMQLFLQQRIGMQLRQKKHLPPPTFAQSCLSLSNYSENR